MAVTPETGILALADLTGYTAYLTGGELEHAPRIAGDLLETIVARLEPPFRLAKLEGDAAFVFAEDGRADPALLWEALETAYLAFRRRLRSIAAATACSCNACALAPRLNLKLLAHHGTWVRTTIAGRDELAGADVILVHRLLKARALAESHSDGAALVTRSAASALGLDPGEGTTRATTEVPDGFGPVDALLVDLEARWRTDADRVLLEPAEALVDETAVVAAERSIVWQHLTRPALRSRWESGLRVTVVDGPADGGLGSVSHCVSGRLATLEEVVDWQPESRAGWRVIIPGVGRIAIVAELNDVAGGAGTRLRMRWATDGEGDPGALEGLVDARRRAFGRLITALEPVTPQPADGRPGSKENQ